MSTEWQQRLDDVDEPMYPIGVAADLLDVSAQVLRRYDSEDVVRPERTAGGQRRYSRGDIGRLAYVLELAGEGIPSSGIRRILDLEDRVAALEDRTAED